jgi:S-adenosylmethionine:tRNA ribosyltransferase-isomerase
MRTSDFDYDLPLERIAQTPAPHRDGSRLLVVDRATGGLTHHLFHDLPQFLRPGDLLVLNNSKVLPARLRAVKPDTGGRCEILLLEENAVNDWNVMFRPVKRVRPGTLLRLLRPDGQASEVRVEVVAKFEEGHCRLKFSGAPDLRARLDELGEMPLPPYIERPVGNRNPEDRERYQTVFASQPGSVAAPTAGLHFTPELLATLTRMGVSICYVTLHVGAGTFAPVKTEELSEHPMHEEYFELEAASAQALVAAKREQRRVVAVGTTSMRVLESVAAQNQGQIVPTHSRTRLFIYPPRKFEVVDVLLTNFHLPKSTLLMLVSAFAAPESLAGRDLILNAYQEAIRQKYRFFSYGDAMLIQ